MPRAEVVSLVPARAREAAPGKAAGVALPSPRTASSSRWFSLALAAFVAGIVGWACLGTVDVVATAEGLVLPIDRVKRISGAESGSVRKIYVDDGEHVTAGQPLIDLDSTLQDSERDRLKNNLLMARVAAIRFRALLEPPQTSPGPVVFPDGLDARGAEDQRQLLRAERSNHDSQIKSLDQEIQRREADLRTSRVTSERYRNTAPLLRERADVRRKLAEDGYGPRLTYLETELAAREREYQALEVDQTIAGIEAAIEGLRAQQAKAEADFRQSVLTRLIEAERLAISLGEELTRAEQHVSYQHIVAPVAGVITQNAVHTIGGTVAAGQVMMQIVPDDVDLEVEARVLNRDVGFVRNSQTAQVKFDAFQFTVHGTMPGEVREVAHDAIFDSALGLVYPTRVKLSRQVMSVNGQDVPLSSGMRVSVDILTERRRIIEYLAAPFFRIKGEAMRQR
jgi:hemolysin D